MATIRKSKKQYENSSPSARQEKKKFRRGVILLVVLLLLITAVAVALWSLNSRLFEKNPSFILREVQVSSSGYWGSKPEHSKALIRKLGIQVNKDNIFALDAAKLRNELRNIPNIADAQVKTVLPDMLQITVEERIPRAFLGRPNAGLVVDANGMIMESRQCFGIHPKLPVIVGMHNRGIKAGATLPALREALALLMSVQRYECFTVVLISMIRNDVLNVTMDYRAGNRTFRYYVTLPHGNYPELLDILRSAIEDARRHNDSRNTVDLTFDGAVVMSNPER